MPKPEMTANDFGWALLFMVLFLPLTAGAMLVSAIFLTPAVLGSPNSMPRHGVEKFVEAALLFGGMAFGMCLAILIFAILVRQFLSRESFQRWVLQFENGAPKLPPLHRTLGRLIIKYIRPKESV
jgi:hypothetical protein